MPKSKYSEAAILGALQQLDAGRKAADVAREVGVSTCTIYAWKAKYGGLTTCGERSPNTNAVRLNPPPPTIPNFMSLGATPAPPSDIYFTGSITLLLDILEL